MTVTPRRRLRVTSEAAARAVLKKAAQVASRAELRLFSRDAKPLSADRMDFYLSRCHAKQKLALLDANRFKALLCPRRTGKSTYTLFEALIHAERYPESTIAYIVPDSRAHARDLFWKPLKILDRELELGLQFHEVDKRVTTPSGTDILLLAAHDKDSPARLRGNAYSLVVLDECKDFGPHFEELIVEAVLPGLGDYGGTLVLAGTPGSVLAGLFYSVTAKGADGFTVHRWIKSDNTFLKETERDLDLVWESSYKPFGVTKDSPKFRREQLAEWCTDDTERVYLYDRARNDWDGELPKGPYGHPHEWMYALGLDLGERDANAFVVWAFSPTNKNLFCVHQYSRARMSIEEIARHLEKLQAEYPNFVQMVADTGGYGRGIVTELQNRYGIPLVAADKGKNKLGNIELMNSDFLSGKIKCQSDTPLAKEWLRLTKKIRMSDRKVLLEHTDLGDAALYAWKAGLAYASVEEQAEPLPGTDDYWKKQQLQALHDSIREYRGRMSDAPSERDY